MASCLSIIVAKLDPGSNYFGSEIPDDVASYTEAVELNTVTSVNVDRTMVYDEGDTRITYFDHLVTIKAILTDDMVFGEFIDGDVPPNPLDPFNDRLEKIYNHLSAQGLAINFGAYPGPIRKLLPSDGNNDPASLSDDYAAYTKRTGWMVDSFNGPKTLDITMSTLPGQEAIELVWKVKFRTANDNNVTGNTTSLTTPKISNEVRMDIGEDGDLRVVVDGTIYADSLADIYKARDYIEVKWTADSTRIPGKGNVADPDFFGRDIWAIVNGFKKTVTFNVDKSGRSAKFQIVYSQLKSNNAQPYYLRDIKCEQTVESNLLGKGLYAGFTGWKNNFKIKITVPPRMSPNYAWFIAHQILQQQNRRAQMKYKSVTDSDNPPELGQGNNKGLVKDEILGSYFPLRFKVVHQHYSRSITFEIDQLLLCPITAVLGASCILNRINNDYQRRLTNTTDPYVPESLSKQHNTWQFSTERGKDFNINDLSSGDPRALTSIHKPHRDTAGTEVLDSGHNYDAYKSLDDQTKQKILLVTNIYDSQDFDPDYNTDGTNSPYNLSSPSLNLYNEKTGDPNTLGYPEQATLNDIENNYQGLPGPPAAVPFSINRVTYEIHPNASYIKYNQEYEITETNPTLPVEGLASVDQTEFQAPDSLRTNAGLNEQESGSNSNLGNAELLSRNPNNQYVGRTSANERNFDEVYEGSDSAEREAFNNRPVRPRKTYAMTAPRYYITVKGHAIRAKYKVPIPCVLEIAGQPATRVGNGRYKHTNLTPGGDLPVYLAMWEQTYTIDKSIVTDDILSSIQDTGASVIYV